MNWKIIAIVFIILFVLENIFIGYGMYFNEKEVRLTNQCYYDVCSEQPEAFFDQGVCYCYSYDLYGELKLEKTELLN